MNDDIKKKCQYFSDQIDKITDAIDNHDQASNVKVMKDLSCILLEMSEWLGGLTSEEFELISSFSFFP